MSALDIGARGVALGARKAFERTDEGNASLAWRSEPSAAALEALASQYSLLTGEAGATYTVDTGPYIMRDRLVIRGNGAELRNVNPTPLDVDHNVSAGLNLGTSSVWATPFLTYYPVLSTSGSSLTLSAGAGENFAPGDLVVLHGATTYPGPENEYDVFRNYIRARVVRVTGDEVELDRSLPRELVDDGPVVANTAEDMVSYLPGAPQYYLLYAPYISNLTVSSNLGTALQNGGVIDGVFRDLTLHGRNGLALNAMQDCLFENIRFVAWRKICELAEGSYGTIVRNMRGVLTDAGARFGGASDIAPFFIALGESSSECVLDDLAVDSGPNNATGAGVIFGSGRNNELRNSRLRFPALTVSAISIQTVATAGHPNADCGFLKLTVTAPVCSQFFVCSDGGAGIVRPYLEGSRFLGAPSLRAATLRGVEGRFCGNFFESGDIQLDNSTVRCRIEGNTVNGSMNPRTNPRRRVRKTREISRGS